MKLELCIDSYQEALIARHYQFDRIELCSALTIGGITPSAGMIQRCVSVTGIETHVMIRPRGGGFMYSADELKIMQNDIQISAELGADGVVFGILDEYQHINTAANRILINFAKKYNLNATFHRAFDLVKNPNESLHLLIDLGFDRLLTSGQSEKAEDGYDLIQRLLEKADQKIQIMAGSGINESNVLKFKQMGIDALHFTARKPNQTLHLGLGESFQPDKGKIESILNALRNAN